MTWQLAWVESALRDLKGLDGNVALRVHKAVRRFADTGHGDIKKLQGAEEYRLRVGDWRVRFELLKPTTTMRVLRVLHRSKAYR